MVCLAKQIVAIFTEFQYFFFHLCSLGPLVTKVKDVQVETIVEHLCTNMSSDKEQLRDISSIGLKTVISELPLTASGMAASVSCS